MKAGTVVFGVLVAALLAGACSNSPTAATTTGETLVFSYTLVPRGADSHTFAVTQAGPIAITMTNAPSSVVGLGFGTPNPSSPLGCSLTTTVVAAPDTNAQITSSASVGSYCVEIFDVGNLTVPVAFSITLVSGSTSSTSPTTVAALMTTENFSGTLAVGGTSFYPFTVSQAGVVNVTLVSVTGPKVPASVSLNVGIGTFDGTTCTPTVASNVQPGSTPQVTGSLSAGLSCVQVADVGNLVGPATFDITIVHP